VLSDASGAASAALETDAFGNTISASGAGTPFGFGSLHGYQSDADSGLMRLGHRYYEPSTGRFLSRDPIQDGYNWYAYCGNDPVNAVDPSGLTIIVQDPSGKHGDLKSKLEEAIEKTLPRSPTWNKIIKERNFDGGAPLIIVIDPDFSRDRGGTAYNEGNTGKIILHPDVVNGETDYYKPDGRKVSGPVPAWRILAHEIGHVFERAPPQWWNDPPTALIAETNVVRNYEDKIARELKVKEMRKNYGPIRYR
jgi:RHS repeat-associated protein